MNLLNLAPEIQQQILFAERHEVGEIPSKSGTFGPSRQWSNGTRIGPT